MGKFPKALQFHSGALTVGLGPFWHQFAAFGGAMLQDGIAIGKISASPHHTRRWGFEV